MLASYVVGLVAVVLLSVAWVAVQSAWRRVFPPTGADPDALAGRTGCHGCAGGAKPAAGGCKAQDTRRESHE